MFRIGLLSLLILTLNAHAFSQITINSQKTIGGTAADGLNLAGYDSSGNKILVGQSSSDTSFDKTEDSRGGNDIWIVKLDPNNNIIWDKTIGGDNEETRIHALIKNDTIFILSSSASGVSGEKTTGLLGITDCWLVAMDLNANILWQKSYGGESSESYSSITLLPNNNLLIVINSKSGVSGNKTEANIGLIDFWILEISTNNGDILQQKSIGSVNSDILSQTIISPSNTILIKGNSDTGISGNKTAPGFGGKDIWILELDMGLNIIRDVCLGGDGYEQEIGGDISADSQFYYISVSSTSGISGNKTEEMFDGGGPFPKMDTWLIKTDHNFNVIWDKTIGGFSDDYIANSVLESPNKIILSISSYSTPSGNKTSEKFGESDVWIVILNTSDGNIVAQKTLGGDNHDGGRIYRSPLGMGNLDIYASSSSGVSGNKTTINYGDSDAWILSIDASDFVSINEEESSFGLSVYPLPFKEQLTFNFSDLNETVNLKLYSINGALIYDQQIAAGTNAHYINNLNCSGVIIYKISGSTFVKTGKLIAE